MLEQRNIDPVEELCAIARQHPELVKFSDYHRKNPEVLDFLVTEYRVLLENERRAFSFQSLFEYCRWKIIRKRRAATFKLNDHLAPFYARAIAILHPSEVNGLATFRKSVADEVFGVRLAAEKPKGAYARPLVWADGTALTEGWKPSTPHVPRVKAKRRPDTH